MLTADQIDDFAAPVLELYDEFHTTVLADIARRLAKAPMTSTAAWQAQRLAESGMVYEEILERLSQLLGRSEPELRRAFERAGVKAMRYDDSLYRRAGMEPLPLNLSPAMLEVLRLNIARTSASLRNLALSTALTGQDAFLEASDVAFMQVASGTNSYQEAVRGAVKQMAARGLSTISYASGRRDQLDVAARRSLLTGVGQLANQLSMARAEEMGQDLVQVSAHAGARPSHQVWQGKIYSRSGTDPDYPSLVAATGYGTAEGLAGINCRHSLYPFFKGISENAYDRATLAEINGKRVTYQGQEMSLYDASQKQREIERKIRYWKRQRAVMEAAGLNTAPETEAVLFYQKRMREFIAESGLVRQRSREQVPGV